MSNLSERASYLKGLADGMNLNPEKIANRLLLEVINLLSDTAAALDELRMDHEVLEDLVEAIDEDVTDLEDELSDTFDRLGEPEDWDPDEDDDDEDFFAGMLDQPEEDDEEEEPAAEDDAGEEEEPEAEESCEEPAEDEPETDEESEADEPAEEAEEPEAEPAAEEEAEEEEASAEEEEDDEDAVLYTCPHCGREVKLDLADLDFDEDMPCPKCGKPLFPETLDELEETEAPETESTPDVDIDDEE